MITELRENPLIFSLHTNFPPSITFIPNLLSFSRRFEVLLLLSDAHSSQLNISREKKKFDEWLIRFEKLNWVFLFATTLWISFIFLVMGDVWFNGKMIFIEGESFEGEKKDLRVNGMKGNLSSRICYYVQ